jgi:DNA-binding response OmpR family regulator
VKDTDMALPKILLIDNSRSYLEIYEELIHDPSLKILIAHDGEQALDTINAEHPDLIIMDAELAESEKEKICAALNANADSSSSLLIMIVDAESSADKNDCLLSGCWDYITKPLDRKSLIEKIRNYLPAKNRSAPRINCNIPVVLQFEDTLAMVPCDNISIEGLFVKSELKVDAGREVLISFILPGDSKTKTKIKATGHVVWINNKRSLHSKVPIGFGIKINEIIGDKISQHRREELMAFIKSNKK